MKVFLKSLPLIGQALTKLHHWRIDPARRIRNIFRGRKDLCIVQTGSNDGVTGDPVHLLLQSNPSWKALLVEPVPFLFERLRKNYYGNPNIKFANVAITEKSGIADFYYIDPTAKDYHPELPYWFDQLGSFDRGHIARHFGIALDNFIIPVQVVTLPLSTVLDRNNVAKINLLHIDTEGHDWIVLRQLDLMRFRPDVILIEHLHLSANDKSMVVAFLERDYSITKLAVDFLCRKN